MHYRLLSFTVIFFILFAGGSLRSQNVAELEQVYRKDLKKARQYPENSARIASLAASYDAVSNADQAAINSLKSSGQPDIWYDVYRILVKADARQNEMKTLPESALLQMNFSFRNYSEEMELAKKKAEGYLYAHAKKLLDEEKPASARIAYRDLVLLATLSNEYKDMDVMIRKAVLTGATDIQYELVNQTGMNLNTEIVDMLSVAVKTYRQTRMEQAGTETQAEPFPFVIRIYLTELKVSPERTKKQEYGEERDVYEGGTVVDTIRCSIEQYRQVKGAVISGKIDIFDVTRKNVINTVPLTAESMFVHTYATLKGNPDAAGTETRALLAQKEVEFPSSEAIVMDAVTEFTKQVVGVLIPPTP